MKEHLLYTKQTQFHTKDGSPRYATILRGQEIIVLAKLRILGLDIKTADLNKSAAVWLPVFYTLPHPLMWLRDSGKSWGFDYWSYQMWRAEIQEEADNRKGIPVGKRMPKTRKNAL